jgi:class 3 adenylate cyclase
LIRPQLTEDVESLPTFSVDISNTSKNLCLGLVDMVNSTKISAKLPQKKAARYYEIFLNSMAKVLCKYYGVVIKNIGDSLLFYFPEPSGSNKNCLECSLAMIDEHQKIKELLEKEGLPPVDYRISLDYGYISIMKSTTSSFDVIGTPVNVCAKINRQASVNGIIIGGDLYQMVKNFDEHYLKQAFWFSIDLDKIYPIYSVRRKNNSRNDQ